MKQSLNVRLIVVLAASLVLTILPMPEFLVAFRPAWVLLLVLYVQFFLPAFFRVTWVFLLGLCLDVLLSTTMGEHAFALLLTTWIAAGKTRRFHFFSMIQQMILVLLFCCLYQLMIYLIDASLGYTSSAWCIVGAACMGMMFWPWVRVAIE